MCCDRNAASSRLGGGSYACPLPSLEPSPEPLLHALARPAPATREQHLPELLDVAYGLLRMRYLSHAWQLLRGAGSWQAAEAALLLFSAVSLAVKTRVLSDAANGGDDGSSGSGDATAAAVAEDRQQTQQLLSALFGQLCSPEGGASMLGAHPVLAGAACLLVERYASWFGRAPAVDGGTPVKGAFELLLRGLLMPQVGESWCAEAAPSSLAAALGAGNEASRLAGSCCYCPAPRA